MKFPRHLFNGDCNFLFYNPELWQPEGGPYRAAAIHCYVGQIAASGIDTLLVNPNTQVAWYPSPKQENVFTGYRRGDRRFIARIASANAALPRAMVGQYIDVMTELFDHCLDLSESGVDWLAECARACRAHRLTPWLSYRMNATHFSGAPNSPVNCRLFREARYRLSGRPPGARRKADPAWVGLNYACAPVRDYMFEMIREGVEDYDYAGLELDWLRHPLCVEAPASQRDTDAITAWIADLRTLTRAQRKSYPLGLRVPGNFGYLRSIGLDVPALAQRGLIDFVTFSNYWQTPWSMPLDALRRELGPDVRVYGGMEGAPNWLPAIAPALTTPPAYQKLQLAGDSAITDATAGPARAAVRGTRYLPASAPLLRGNAAGKLVLGVDGLEQFNFFVTDQVRVPGQRADYRALRGLADLGALRGTEKHYAFNTASGHNHEWWDAPMALPAKIPAGQSRTFRLPMCAEPPRTRLQLIVQVIAAKPASARSLGVSVNGGGPVFSRRPARDLLFACGPYRRHVPEHAAWNFRPSVTALRDGWNEIAVHNCGAQPLRLIGLELAVKISRHATS
ncbi:MAG: hypothetical protein JSS11_08685 [Verrucomicrobia bacterium]|nr:hypothetical protein [Verrucomicrobiota bacterium]